MSNYDPCYLCGDRVCCRQMCRAKKDYLDFQEGKTSRFVVKNARKGKKLIITVNKNGIRREEYYEI